MLLKVDINFMQLTYTSLCMFHQLDFIRSKKHITKHYLSSHFFAIKLKKFKCLFRYICYLLALRDLW